MGTLLPTTPFSYYHPPPPFPITTHHPLFLLLPTIPFYYHPLLLPPPSPITPSDLPTYLSTPFYLLHPLPSLPSLPPGGVQQLLLLVGSGDPYCMELAAETMCLAASSDQGHLSLVTHLRLSHTFAYHTPSHTSHTFAYLLMFMFMYRSHIHSFALSRALSPLFSYIHSSLLTSLPPPPLSLSLCVISTHRGTAVGSGAVVWRHAATARRPFPQVGATLPPTLSIHLITTITPPCQSTLSIHPINPPYQSTLSTSLSPHLLN